jgi:hypothetical protein
MTRRFSTTLQLADKEYLFLETREPGTKNKAGWNFSVVRVYSHLTLSSPFLKLS